MLGLFISYKDVIRQINSADTQGCVFNGCVSPRLVISRQPLLQNHTLHLRPRIRNLTTSSRTVMTAYVSHRLGLPHLPARFDVGIHVKPLCKSPVHARVSFSSRLRMPSFQHGDAFQSNGCVFASEAQTFIWANHLYGSIHHGLGLHVQVSCCEEHPGSRWAISTYPAPLPLLMTCRWWFSPSACFFFFSLARNKFPFSLTRDILFKLDREG